MLKTVGSIVKNPKYVNAGIGDVKSIATTAFQKGGLPIENGKCMMHAQANFYASNWDKGTRSSKAGDVYAFYEPTMQRQVRQGRRGWRRVRGRVLRPARGPGGAALPGQRRLGDLRRAERKVGTPAGLRRTTKVDKSVFKDPIDKLSVQLLTDPKSTARFDASDAMPSSVGAGTFWTQMTQWILGNVRQGEPWTPSRGPGRSSRSGSHAARADTTEDRAVQVWTARSLSATLSSRHTDRGVIVSCTGCTNWLTRRRLRASSVSPSS